MRIILGFCLFIVSSWSVFGEEVAVVSFVQGVNYAKSNRFKTGRETLKLGSILEKGDTIVSEEGSCEIQLATHATIRTNKYTEIKIDRLLDNSQTALELVSGKLFVKAHKEEGEKRQLNVSTPSYVAGVRGTEFLLATPNSEGEDDEINLNTGVYVNEGSVGVTANGSKNEVVVSENEEIVSQGNKLKKQILNEFAKEKMRIFAEFKQIKKENYERYKEQRRKNSEILNQFKSQETD